MNIRTEAAIILTALVVACVAALVLNLMGLQLGLWILGVS